MNIYKRSLWIMLPHVLCIFFTADSIASYPPVTVHITNHADNNSTSVASSYAHQSVSQQFSFVLTVSEQLHGYKNALSNYLHIHKYYALAGTLGACYTMLWVELYLYKRCIENNLYWAQWRASMTNTQLLEESSNALTHELLYAIQEHYVHYDEPVNPLLALACYMNDTTQEKKILDEYERLTSFLQRMRLARLFPLVIMDKDSVTAYSERLALISYVFKTWTVNQRFDSLQLKREIIV